VCHKTTVHLTYYNWKVLDMDCKVNILENLIQVQGRRDNRIYQQIVQTLHVKSDCYPTDELSSQTNNIPIN
jgi:hypothetical protein